MASITTLAATDLISDSRSTLNTNFSNINSYIGTNTTPTTPGAASRVLRSTSATETEWAALVLSTDVTGTLPVANGGTGATTLTGLLQGNGTSAITGISNSSTVGQVLRVTGASTYAWGSLDLADGDAITGTLPTANGGTGIAYFTAAGPTAARTFTFPDANATILTSNAAVTVGQGGTGVTSLTTYAVICGGTTSTGAVQSIASVGSSGQVLTSNGAGALPTFQAAAGGGANEFTFVLDPSNAILPNSNFAAPGRVVGTTFSYDTLDFDTTTSESAYWAIPIPPSVTPSTHKITIIWTNAAGLTTETVQFDVDWRSVSDSEVLDAATTPTTTNDTVSDTWLAQGDAHSVTLTMATATNVVANDILLIKISRDVANDNMTGDLRFVRALYEIT